MSLCHASNSRTLGPAGCRQLHEVWTGLSQFGASGLGATLARHLAAICCAHMRSAGLRQAETRLVRLAAAQRLCHRCAKPSLVKTLIAAAVGRRADQQAVRVHGAQLGAEADREHRRQRRDGRQHPRRRPRHRGELFVRAEVILRFRVWGLDKIAALSWCGHTSFLQLMLRCDCLCVCKRCRCTSESSGSYSLRLVLCC